MMSSCLSEVDQLLSEVNVKLCEANVKLSKSFEVQSKRKLLPRVQMILSELEWIVDMSDEEDVSVSSCESLSWDSFNERKWEMSETWELGDHNNSEVSSLASISSSPSDVEEEESLEDVFQTITPTNPTQTQPTSPSPPKYVTISCSTAPSCSTPKRLTAAVRVRRIAPQTGPVRTTSCTSFSDAEDESEIEEVNKRKCEPQVDDFVSKMSAKVAALAPLATYKPVKEVEYPQVDFNHLNSHFIKNIPKPESYPIYGCSEDSEFYDISKHGKRPTFFNSFPFGAKPGYDTNLGIVAVPDQPIFGYIWTENHGFKIHAAPPSSRASCTSSGAIPRGQRRGRSGG